MKEIMVPQELKEKIIYLYVEKQYGRAKIIKELNLPFGDGVLKKILQQNNIHIRNFSESKKGSPKIEVPQELQNQIIDLYSRGYGLSKIVELLQLAFSFDKVRSILQENNIHIRTLEESAQVKIFPDLRKYSINDNYNLISHNGAWLMGFIAADGYLPNTKGARNRIVIALQRRDEEILKLIAEELSYNGKIYQYLSNGHETSCLAFNSKQIRETLEKCGIVNNKTYKIKSLPNIPEEYMIDYIRGYFDGDGSLYEPKDKKIGTSFTSANKEFLEDLSSFLSKKFNLSTPKINKSVRENNIVYDIRYYVKDSLKLCNIFYNNNYLSLPRKKNHYLEIMKKITPTSLNTPQG